MKDAIPGKGSDTNTGGNTNGKACLGRSQDPVAVFEMAYCVLYTALVNTVYCMLLFISSVQYSIQVMIIAVYSITEQGCQHLWLSLSDM